MRIAQVESLLLGGAHFVRVHADDGTCGLGQSACWGYPEAVDAIVTAHFAPYLAGQDPLRIEHHWQHLHRMGPFRGAALGGALSAIDIALWDLKGKLLGQPIWQLLGGRCRDRVRLCLLLDAHDDETAAQRAAFALREGFTAVKIDPLLAGYEDAATPALVAGAVRVMTALRDAVGDDVDIMVELHRKLSPVQVLPVVDALARFHPLWVEDPVQIDSVVTHADLAVATGVPFATGERLHTIWEFRELLEAGRAQHCRPDLGLAGGFTHVRKIAAVAESFHAPLSPHNFLGPALTAASVQLDATIPNFQVQEYSLFDEDPGVAAALPSAYRREGGWMPLADAPGLGVELDVATTAKLSPLAEALAVPARRDGSLAWSV